MSHPQVTSPLTFEPLFMERIWGGRRLESVLGKSLPAGRPIGESWEISDRTEAQSVVRDGPLRGTTLHDLWLHHRPQIFGNVAGQDRFPLLIKLLDAEEKLSLQVHPPEQAAEALAGEPKTEFWYILAAEPDAELYVGLRRPIARKDLADALESGTAADHVHKVQVKPGDAMFLPSGRLHALGAGTLLVEVQQNSDTTYRVFDWNRVDHAGKPRELHIDQALQCIDFTDCEPQLLRPDGESLIRNELFEIEKWQLEAPREVVPAGRFAIVFCLTGKLRCSEVELKSGEFFLVPAHLPERKIHPGAADTSLLRITIPA